MFIFDGCNVDIFSSCSYINSPGHFLGIEQVNCLLRLQLWIAFHVTPILYNKR